MANEVDEEVVQLSFDNKNFEKNVKTSLNTLDKLKNSLNFKGAEKGFDNIDDASKRVNFNKFGGAIESVKIKFSALEVVAITALTNITNNAINAGKKMISSLTITPMKTGFSEYELKMGSIQTIMASTGESLETVNGYLNELNTYSDKTIYSFSDMTQNIGKFTNAGVKLKDAVNAIKGISNEAAISGANANEASRAMYNFAQALSAGSVKLIDWKSIEYANMATVPFKENLMATAVELGTLKKVGDKYVSTTKNIQGRTSQAFTATSLFNESLNSQWMTTEVLVKTLGEYADETTEIGKKAFAAAQDVKTYSMMMDTLREAMQSGWAETWEIIFGDFNEAKKLWTSISNVLGEMIEKISEARNAWFRDTFYSNWKKLCYEIDKTGISVDDFSDKIIDLSRKSGIEIDKLLEDGYSLSDLIEEGKIGSKIIRDAINEISKSNENLSKSSNDVTGTISELGDVVKQVMLGEFGNGKARYEALTKAGYDYYVVQDLVNKTVNGEEIAYEKMSDAQLESLGYTEDQIKAIKELSEEANKAGSSIDELIKSFDSQSESYKREENFITGLKNIMDSLRLSLGAVAKAWDEVFRVDSKLLYGWSSSFSSISTYFKMDESNADKLYRTMKGLFSVISLTSSFVGGIFTGSLKLLSSVMGVASFNFLDITAKIGDMITGFYDWIYTNNSLIGSLKKMGSSISLLLGSLYKFISKFFEIDEVKDIFTDFGSVVDNVAAALNSYLSTGAERIKEFSKWLSSIESFSFEALVDSCKKFSDNVISYFIGLKTNMNDVEFNISSFGDTVSSKFEEAGNSISNFGKKIWSFLSSIGEKISKYVGFGELLTIGFGASLVYSFISISKAINKFSGIVGILNGFDGMIKNVNMSIKAFTKKTKAKELKNIAEAIGILALSIKLLASIEDRGKLWSSIGAIAVLSGILVGLSFAMSKFGESSGKKLAGTSAILSISASLFVLAKALKVMDDLKTGKMWGNFALLGLMAGGLTALATILSKNEKDLTRGALVFISISFSLKILVGVLKDLDGFDMEHPVKTLLTFVGLLGSLILAVKLMGTKNVASAGLGLLAMSASLFIVVKALKSMEKLNPKSLIVNFAAMSGIFKAMGSLMFASMFAGENIGKAGLGMLAMSASLLLIIHAFKKMETMNLGTIIKGVLAISALFYSFGGLMVASMFAGDNAIKAGAMMLMMSGAVAILTGVIVGLSKIPFGDLTKAIAAIGVIEILFAGLIAVTHLAKGVTGTIIAISVAIGILAVAIGTLSLIKDQNALKNATIALSAIMISLSILVASTSLAKPAIGSLALLSVIVAGIGALLVYLSGFNVENVLKVSVGISTLLLSLSAACLILTAVGLGGPAALIGIGVLAAMIATIGSLNLSEFGKNLSDFMINFIPFIAGASLIKSSMVENVSALVDMIMTLTKADLINRITSWLPGKTSLGDIIDEFVEVGPKLKIFGTSVSNIKTESIKNASLALKSIIDVAKGIPNQGGKAITWLIGDNTLSMFGDELEKIGPKLKQFSIDVEDVKVESVKNASLALKSIIDVAKGIPNQGGKAITWLIGDNTLSVFGDELEDFGPKLKQFSIDVEDVKIKNVKNASKSLKCIMKAISELPNHGGLMSEIFGDNKLSEMGTELEDFGPKLSKYSKDVADVVLDSIKTSMDALVYIADAASKVPSHGGKIREWFTGDNTLAFLGSELSSFSDTLKTYPTDIKDESIEVIKKSMDTLTYITTAASKIPGVNVFSGKNSMSYFGIEMSSLGSSFLTYYNYVKDVDFAKLSDASCELRKLVSIANNIQLVDSGSISFFASQFSSLGKKGIDSFINAFYNSSEQINESITKTIDGIIMIIINQSERFKRTSSSLMDRFIAGLNLKREQISNELYSIIDNSLYSTETLIPKATSIGISLIDGFIIGMKSKTQEVIASAYEIAESIPEEIKKVLDIDSPSKVAYSLGSYFGTGFVNSILDYSKNASRASEDLANSAKDGLKKAMLRIDNEINDDINLCPTIRPVLDLSSVTSKSRYLSSILSKSQAASIGVSGINNANNVPEKQINNDNSGSIIMYQYNNSPKPLSRIDIYRNTKNQLSMAKGLVRSK